MQSSSNVIVPNSLVWTEADRLTADKINKIVTEVNAKIKIMIRNVCEQAYTTEISGIVIDDVEVKTKVYIRGIKKIECIHCHEMIEHVGDHVIKNRITSEKLYIPNYVAHCLQHGKDLEQYQITLTQAAKVLS